MSLVRDGTEKRGQPIFVREGIIIPDVRGRTTRGFRSLVIADDKPIATMLGDSENPAHTVWQKDGSNYKSKYLRVRSEPRPVREGAAARRKPMASSRLNYTGRKRIGRKDVRITVHEPAGAHGAAKPAKCRCSPGNSVLQVQLFERTVVDQIEQELVHLFGR